MRYAFLCLLLLNNATWADTTWHCSRNVHNAMHSQMASAEKDQFSIAAVGSAPDVINVSIRDLLDLYSGVTVRISGLTLSACFMPSNRALTSSALNELGLNASTMLALSRKNAIVQNNLHLANDEVDMLRCIENNFPAVGYMSTTTESELVAPCF
jgi:hypothetical protein